MEGGELSQNGFTAHWGTQISAIRTAAKPDIQWNKNLPYSWLI